MEPTALFAACIAALTVLIIAALARPAVPVAGSRPLGPAAAGLIAAACLAGGLAWAADRDLEPAATRAPTMGPARLGGGRFMGPRRHPAGGIFAQLRGSGPMAQVARTRVRHFFRSPRFVAQGMPIVTNGPPSDAATLYALRAAYQRIGRPAPPARARRGQARVAAIEAFLPAHPGPGYRYLDIGSSEGRITAAVAERLGLAPAQATAVDISPQAPNPAFEFVRIDGRTLPFNDGTFDLITMFMSAHHFANAPRVFAEAHRVARPGARLILREHGRADAATALYYDFVHAFYEAVTGDNRSPAKFAATYARGDYAHYRTPAEWVSLAAEAGFAPLYEGVPGTDKFDAVVLAFVRDDAAKSPAPQ